MKMMHDKGWICGFDVGIVVIVGLEVLGKSYHHPGINFRQVLWHLIGCRGMDMAALDSVRRTEAPEYARSMRAGRRARLQRADRRAGCAKHARSTVRA
mgnify:CR=1 FL=1